MPWPTSPGRSGSPRRRGAGVPADLDGAVAMIVATHGRNEDAVIRAALEAGVPFIGLVASPTRGKAVLDRHGRSPATSRPGADARRDLTSGPAPREEIALSILAELVGAVRLDGIRPVSASPADRPREAVDPVCGMTVLVGPDTPHLRVDGVDHWFCNSGMPGPVRIGMSDSCPGGVHRSRRRPHPPRPHRPPRRRRSGHRVVPGHGATTAAAAGGRAGCRQDLGRAKRWPTAMRRSARPAAVLRGPGASTRRSTSGTTSARLLAIRLAEARGGDVDRRRPVRRRPSCSSGRSCAVSGTAVRRRRCC